MGGSKAELFDFSLCDSLLMVAQLWLLKVGSQCMVCAPNPTASRHCSSPLGVCAPLDNYLGLSLEQFQEWKVPSKWSMCQPGLSLIKGRS